MRRTVGNRVAALDELGHLRRSVGDMRGAARRFVVGALPIRTTVPTECRIVDPGGERAPGSPVGVSRRRRSAGPRPDPTPIQQHARGHAATGGFYGTAGADDARDCEAPLTAELASESRHGASCSGDASPACLVPITRGAPPASVTGASPGRPVRPSVAQFYRVWASLLAVPERRRANLQRQSARRQTQRARRGRVSSRPCVHGCCETDPAAAAVARQGLADARAAILRSGALAGLQLGLSSLECRRFGDARTELEHLDRRLGHERLLMD